MTDLPKPGDRASVDHVFAAADVAVFAGLTGDDNPIHLDADAARSAGFERQVVHGMLVASLISRLLGTRLPGPGTILLGQEFHYLRPVHVDDRVTATVEVVSVREDKPVITLRTWVDAAETVIDGQATVLIRSSMRGHGAGAPEERR